MPTLFRFLVVVAILAGLVWGAMYALATFVKPDTRPMMQTIPATRLNR
jgi:phage shock protein PspC (stress-responsive transcriptional regulator)